MWVPIPAPERVTCGALFVFLMSGCGSSVGGEVNVAWEKKMMGRGVGPKRGGVHLSVGHVELFVQLVWYWSLFFFTEKSGKPRLF